MSDVPDDPFGRLLRLPFFGSLPVQEAEAPPPSAAAIQRCVRRVQERLEAQAPAGAANDDQD